MATNLSLVISAAGLRNYNPDSITQGTSAPASPATIELRLDYGSGGGGWNLNELREALDAFDNYLNDGRFTAGANFVTPGV